MGNFMPELTDREIALAQLKALDDLYNVKALKPFIKHFEKLMNENKQARKVLKKIELKLWPPKLTIEYDFPFKK